MPLSLLELSVKISIYRSRSSVGVTPANLIERRIVALSDMIEKVPFAKHQIEGVRGELGNDLMDLMEANFTSGVLQEYYEVLAAFTNYSSVDATPNETDRTISPWTWLAQI